MEKFKIGDKVVCVDDVCADLTIGKTYEVVGLQLDLGVYIRDDMGELGPFYEGRFKLAEALGCSLRAIRNRIYEIDNLLTSLAAERVELVQKLSDEGFALIDKTSKPLDVNTTDMTDWRNWQERDLVKVIGSGLDQVKIGEVLKVRRLDFEDNDQPIQVGGSWPMVSEGHFQLLEWHSRPSK